MRLLIIGSMDGQIGAASKIAIERGAKVSHTPDISSALSLLRSGKGAELLMIDAILHPMLPIIILSLKLILSISFSKALFL